MVINDKKKPTRTWKNKVDTTATFIGHLLTNYQKCKWEYKITTQRLDTKKKWCAKISCHINKQVQWEILESHSDSNA